MTDLLAKFINKINNKLTSSNLKHHAKIYNLEFNKRNLCFSASSQVEEWRIETLFTKEPHTISWISNYVSQGDIFYDIGANIGLYSILASTFVGDNGHVYAFEPHAVNFVSLIQNISNNRLGSSISSFSCALGDKTSLLDFNYKSLAAGTSDSQLDSLIDMDENEFCPAYTEKKFSFSIDELIHEYGISPPSHIKIDVDGNEMLILRGMENTLTHHRPKSIQVEINQRYNAELFSFMNSHCYKEVLKGYTSIGQKRIKDGCDPDSISYNALFVSNV